MTEDFRTIADATAAADADGGSAERATLVVYYAEEPGGRTRLITVPEGAEVTFGRSRANTVHIDSERVSRNHARLRRNGDQLSIEDLGSRNGTKVNGERIDGPRLVDSGDEIRVGPATVVVNRSTRAVRHMIIGSTAHLEERMAAEVDRGLRYHRNCGLIMLHVAGAPAAIDAAVDRLATSLRAMDTLAEYAPNELAVLVPEADANAAAEVARRLSGEARGAGLADEPLVVRTGVATFPVHATQAGELLARARAALRVARTQARDEPVLARAADDTPADSEIVVEDPQMQRVYSLVRKVADTGMTVLIVGETGVGKELVAESVHRASARRDKPFVRLNCASIPESLLESELFGHERGAFTGAERRRIGFFEAADGGTIFLDEIGEVAPSIQTKLLRVLEQRTITRVGGTREIAVDARVVCATNRDLEHEVRRGAFREDLFFRISAFTVVVPPLRDRRADIAPLAARFVRAAAEDAGCSSPRLGDAAREAFERYDWPGNVRELRNAVERAVVLQEQGMIELEHLPDRVREAWSAEGPRPALVVGSGGDVRETIAEVERAAIVAAMEACKGNQTHAARKLGLSRRALIYKLEKYGLKKPPGSK